mmetsp:Transcript_114782/g.244983  ORF Transcript_114782/g.244983 Transcript_114782/m.244983 type:complete len:269 (+) Transcript_114782:247-1053(+)
MLYNMPGTGVTTDMNETPAADRLCTELSGLYLPDRPHRRRHLVAARQHCLRLHVAHCTRTVAALAGRGTAAVPPVSEQGSASRHRQAEGDDGGKDDRKNAAFVQEALHAVEPFLAQTELETFAGIGVDARDVPTELLNGRRAQWRAILHCPGHLHGEAAHSFFLEFWVDICKEQAHRCITNHVELQQHFRIALLRQGERDSHGHPHRHLRDHIPAALRLHNERRHGDGAEDCHLRHNEQPPRLSLVDLQAERVRIETSHHLLSLNEDA